MTCPRTKYEAEQMVAAIADEQAEMAMPPRGPEREAYRERMREMDARRIELTRLHETLPDRNRPQVKPQRKGGTVRDLQRNLAKWFG